MHKNGKTRQSRCVDLGAWTSSGDLEEERPFFYVSRLSYRPQNLTPTSEFQGLECARMYTDGCVLGKSFYDQEGKVPTHRKCR